MTIERPPTTHEVRGIFIDSVFPPGFARTQFDRWLAEVEAAAKKRGAERERERIALALEAHPRRGGHAMYDLAMTEAAAIARADRIEVGE